MKEQKVRGFELSRRSRDAIGWVVRLTSARAGFRRPPGYPSLLSLQEYSRTEVIEFLATHGSSANRKGQQAGSSAKGTEPGCHGHQSHRFAVDLQMTDIPESPPSGAAGRFRSPFHFMRSIWRRA